MRGSAQGGTGVRAESTSGIALQVAGRAVFSRSGQVSVPAGKSYVDVAVPGGLPAGASVLATLQTYVSGVSVAGVRTNVPSAGIARIFLTKVASTTKSTLIAWFVLG